tara:strand:- start:2290 stop:3036 length:747 start_codon:yes stop_codon:yes gene_type:complete
MNKLPILPPCEDEDEEIFILEDDDKILTGVETNDMLDTKITSSKVFGKDFNKKKKEIIIDINNNEVISNNKDNEVGKITAKSQVSIEPNVEENLVLNTEEPQDTQEIVKRVRKKRAPPSQKTLDALAKGREKGRETRRKKKLERLEREKQLLLNDEKDNIKQEIKNETDEENFNRFLEHYGKMKEMKMKVNKKTEKRLENKQKQIDMDKSKKEKLEKLFLLEQEQKQNLKTINLLQPKETNPYSSYFN